MRPLILSLFILAFSFSLSFGQTDSDSVDDKNFKHSLGIGAGLTTGVGMSYRYSFDKFKLQASFAPISNYHSTDYHFGLTALYTLIDTKSTSFYLYQGNNFIYEKSTSYYSSEETIRKTWNHGLGIGIEFIILKRIGFNIMGGYGAFDSFERIGLTGETGLYYMF